MVRTLLFPFFFFFSFLGVAIAALPTDSIGVVNKGDKRFILFRVEQGQTLYRIATKYRVPIAQLMAENPELQNGLKLGQVILIPTTVVSQQSSVSSQKPVIEDNIEEIQKKVKQPTTNYAIPITPYGPLISKDTLIEMKVQQKTSNDELGRTKEEPTISQYEIRNSQYYQNTTPRVLVIPFDPYLYFSDADDEIAEVSRIHRTKIRQAFRRRLNAYLEPKGYETIHLLGGGLKDSTTDINLAYSSITYTYDNVMMKAEREPQLVGKANKTPKSKPTLKDQELSLSAAAMQSRSTLVRDEGKYFAVKIKNNTFFPLFNEKYHADYYIFVSQFEVKTNYEHCLDRALQNYERTFVTHFSIFDKSGKQISGGRVKNMYESNNNHLEKILADNIPPLADQIMSEMPLK